MCLHYLYGKNCVILQRTKIMAMNTEDLLNQIAFIKEIDKVKYI